MGAPRKTAAVLALSGTARKDRPRPGKGAPVTEIDQKKAATEPTEAPKAPNWLPNIHAVRKWRELAPLLIERGRFDAGTSTALAMACAMHGKMVQQIAAGEMPSASNVTQFERLLRGLGLIGGGVVVAPAASAVNRFARNGSRPA